MAESVTLNEKDTRNQALDPEEIIKRARDMLGLGQSKATRELLRQALQQHPKHDALQHLYDIIAPGAVNRVDKQYKNRNLERRWIKENRIRYAGKWVALIDANPIGIEDDLKTLLSKLQDRDLQDTPLIHHLV